MVKNETYRNRTINITRWRETDSYDLFEYAKSDLVGPNTGWQPHKTEDESKEIIRMFRNNADTYAVVLKGEHKVIGSLGFHHRKPDETLSELNQKEIGYVLNPNYWGRGFIPEAVNAAVDYGFQQLNLDIIWCGHFDFYPNSRRVNEKCGFQYQFSKKQVWSLLGNKEVTTLYYSISKQEYRQRDKSN